MTITDLGWLNTVQPFDGPSGKPRHNGLTMVIDKGLGLAALRDLLSVGAEHVDLLKLGFGTSLMYPPGILEKKIALSHQHGVAIYPGGTLLEVAELQGTAEAWLQRLCRLGFNVVEVSDGTIPLTDKRRRHLIKSAVLLGLRVVTEVGKKSQDHKFDVDEVCNQVQADLDAGAERVIIEARDSGKGVGIFDGAGKADNALITTLMERITDPAVILWEAPLVSQQQELILQLGPRVNLGNVQPQDVITLAATRAGLRGDTFRAHVERTLGECSST